MIALLTLIYSAYVIWGFYRDTAGFSPGEEIRPMGVGATLGISESLSILGGGGVALHALVAGLMRKRWAKCGYALLAFFAAWIPFVAGEWGFRYVVAFRHLVLED
jgi:hypothetical protein